MVGLSRRSIPRRTVVAVLALVLAACGGESDPDANRVAAPESIPDMAEANLTRGLEFLARNAERDGVTTTPSGLQYEVITEGSGARPTAASRVTVHYEGTLIDGTIFDSSYRRDETISFGLTQVISGWTEGLQLMSPGSKYKLFLPPDLAYGARGAGDVIGPNETLIFTVELFSFE